MCVCLHYIKDNPVAKRSYVCIHGVYIHMYVVHELLIIISVC